MLGDSTTGGGVSILFSKVCAGPADVQYGYEEDSCSASSQENVSAFDGFGRRDGVTSATMERPYRRSEAPRFSRRIGR